MDCPTTGSLGSGAAGPTTDECALREKALVAMRIGKLPTRKANRTLGGLGSGKTCALCGDPVALTQMEFEIEFNRPGANDGADIFRLHPRCFAAWELEVRHLLAERA